MKVKIFNNLYLKYIGFLFQLEYIIIRFINKFENNCEKMMIYIKENIYKKLSNLLKQLIDRIYSFIFYPFFNCLKWNYDINNQNFLLQLF